MPTLIGTTQRLELNQSSRVGLKEQLSGEKLIFWQGLSAVVRCALFADSPANDTMVDISSLDSANIVVRKNGPNGVILFTKETTSFTPVSYNTWIADTGAQFTFDISELDTTQIVPQSGKLPIYFVVTAVTNDSVPYIAGFGYGEIVDVGFIENPVSSDYVNGRTPIVGGRLLTDLDLNGYNIVDNSSAGYTEEGEVTLTDGQLTVVVTFGLEKLSTAYRFAHLYIKDEAGVPRDVRPFLNAQTVDGFTIQLTAPATAGSILYWRVEPAATVPRPLPNVRYGIVPLIGDQVRYKIVDYGGEVLNLKAFSELANGDDISDLLDQAVAMIASGAIDTQTIFIPRGTFHLSRNFHPSVPVRVVGVASTIGVSEGTILKWTGASGGTMMSFTDINNTGLSYISLDGNSLAANGFELLGSSHGLFQCLHVLGFTTGHGVKLNGTTNTCAWNTFINLVVEGEASNGESCLYLHGNSVTGANACLNTFINTRLNAYGVVRTALKLGGCDTNVFYSTWVGLSSSSNAGVLVEPINVAGALRPNGNQFFELGAGPGGWVQPAEASGLYTKNSVFGYMLSNGEPHPTLNGTTTLYYVDENGVTYNGSISGSLAGTTAIRARVYSSVDIVIASSGTPTALPFNAIRGNNNNIFHPAHNTRLTCTIPGTYTIVGSVSFDINSSGLRLVSIRLNGGITSAEQKIPPVSGNYTSITTTATYDLEVGDYAELIVAQTSGDPVSIKAFSAFSPEFSMVRNA